MKGLNGRTGAVVAIDPTTGAILALASSPSIDPNLLSSHDSADITAEYEKLMGNPDQPMLNRPIAMTLPPGSVFKLVTAAAALESGNFTADSVLPGPKEFPLPLTDKTLGNWNEKACSPTDELTLAEALAVSCNTAFAWLGLQLGPEKLLEQSEKFGFGTEFDIP